jgi:hypothetical protein
MPEIVVTPADLAQEAAAPEAWQEFSLVLGGPLFQLLRRSRLCDDAMGRVQWRVGAVVAITWAPLLALSAAQGAAWGAGPAMPFLGDVGCHLRFLVAVPLLLVAEVIVHRRLRETLEQFGLRGLVRPSDAQRFAYAIARARGLRNSALAEVLILVLVYALGILVVWRRYAALKTDGWYLASGPGPPHLSLAGMWLVLVSVPIFQFLLLRWYFRLFIWARLLLRLSRLDLDLDATHPDKAGGLGFLGASLYAFVPIAAAQGVLLAGVMADGIFFGGKKLTDYQLEAFAAVAILVFLFSSPLLVFAPMLAWVKRRGLLKYGALGQTYVRTFDRKWLRGQPADEPLIGSGDIQSLADLGNSFGSVEQMRVVPMSRMALLYFVLAIVAPILPLALTMTSAEALIGKLVGLVL